MIAEAEQHGLAGREGARLKHRVAVAFLRVLHGEAHAIAQSARICVRLAAKRRMTLQPLQIRVVRTGEVARAHRRLRRAER